MSATTDACDADLALQKALYARLAEDAGLAALIGARLYDNVPGNAVFPYATLGESQVSDWSTGDSAGAEHRLAFHVFSRGGGRAEAKRIMGAIHAALGAAAPAPEGLRLVALHFLDAGTRRETDGTTWRGTIHFRALTELITE